MKISVCMATYNGQQYIVPQLRSILAQLSSHDEVIISDDSSTDETIKNIESLGDPRVVIYYNSGPKGYSKNFENAISKAAGDIIFLSDQDDVWVEDKVEKMVKALESASMVISDAEIVDENLTQLYPSHFKLHGTKEGFFINFLKTRYIGACMAFKKEILIRALPFPENQNLCVHDYWLALIAECYYSVNLVNIPLLKYRRHGKNASTGGSHSNNSVFKIIKTRFYVLNQLFKRKGYHE